jgi:hypothetical protein
MNRIEQLQQTHPWLSEDKARFILTTRYLVFTREMEMDGDTLQAAMDNCVTIYTRMPEQSMRDMVARFEEKFITN